MLVPVLGPCLCTGPSDVSQRLGVGGEDVFLSFIFPSGQQEVVTRKCVCFVDSRPPTHTGGG